MSEPAGEGLKTAVLTEQEKIDAVGVWPCRQCGRFEQEDCAGFSFCPHGRKQPSLLEKIAPNLYAVCREKRRR